MIWAHVTLTLMVSFVDDLVCMCAVDHLWLRPVHAAAARAGGPLARRLSAQPRPNSSAGNLGRPLHGVAGRACVHAAECPHRLGAGGSHVGAGGHLDPLNSCLGGGTKL